VTTLAQRATGGRSAWDLAAVAGVAATCALLAWATASEPLGVAKVVVLTGVVGILLVRLEYAVLVLIASAPLEMATTQGAGTYFTPTKLAGAICLLSFVFQVLGSHRRLVFDATHAAAGGILAIAAMSTVIARDPGSAVSTTTRYASFVVLLFIVSQFSGQPQFYRRAAWVLSAASAYTAYLASSNFLSGVGLRAAVENGDPNDLAFILATTLPLTVWLLRERGLRRLAVSAMIGLISVGIVLTLSRGALLGLAIGALWVVFVERRYVKAVLIGAAVAVVAVTLVVAFNPAPVERGINAKERVATENVNTRFALWSGAARMSADHPVLGVGPGNFGARFQESSDVPGGFQLNGVVHNAYLDVLVELGVVAAVLFLLYLGLCFARFGRAITRRLGPPDLASAARTALVIGVVGALTLSEQYFAPFWLLGGLAVALSRERPEPAAVEG
jgi:O-antigen ligase